MTDKQRRIKALIHSIITYLRADRTLNHGVDSTLDKLEKIDLSDEQLVDIAPQGTRHDKVLKQAIDEIKYSKLQEIACCMALSKDDLEWREDSDQFYPADSDVGEGYRQCNLHSVLIGPDGCGYRHPNFSMGIFMLGPRTLYRDHNHPAPELYLNLSEKSGWRLGANEWRDYKAGSVIWIPSGANHATRVYDQPFISIWCWLEKVNSICKLVHFDDWAEIEHDLTQKSNQDFKYDFQ